MPALCAIDRLRIGPDLYADNVIVIKNQFHIGTALRDLNAYLCQSGSAFLTSTCPDLSTRTILIPPSLATGPIM